ncbi:MAG TPA: PIN domain-containing protein [Actinomycetota bacterium]|nr:PIN domain-containing protein [Actinomycetota bacterium]
MIYLDTSVVLAELLSEDTHPGPAFWSGGPFVSSRLLEYELWVRIHGRGLAQSHGELARDFLSGLALVELAPPVLARALDPFPVPVRTLDALHLATVDFLRRQGQRPTLASYDRRLSEAAAALGVPVADLGAR